MFPLLEDFQLNVISYLYHQRIRLPHKTGHFIYNENYTSSWLADYLRLDHDFTDALWKEENHCYNFIMDELDNVRISSENMGTNDLVQICTSDDLNEDHLLGEYTYYYGIVANTIPFLYCDAIHTSDFPCIISTYGRDIQIDIRTNDINIYIYNTPLTIREMFFIENEIERKMELKNFLLHTDRCI